MSNTATPRNAAAPVVKGRFRIEGATAPTREDGGKVAVGFDRNDVPFVVHSIGRTSESMVFHAVLTAIGKKVITPEEVVETYLENGTLEDLRAAIAEVIPPEVPVETKPAPAAKAK